MIIRAAVLGADVSKSRSPAIHNAAFRALYGFYSTKVLPRIGAWISGSSDAYTYLPESVRKFPDAPALAEEFKDAGYTGVEYQRMTFGIVALHIARKG